MNKHLKIALIIVVPLIAIWLPFFPWNLFPPGQLSEQWLIDRKFQTVSLPGYLTLQHKDCGLHDPVDDGSHCTYDFGVSGHDQATVYGELIATFNKAGYSTDGSTKFDTVVAKGHGLSVYVDIYSQMGNGTAPQATSVPEAVGVRVDKG